MMENKIKKLRSTAESIRLNTFKAIAGAGGGHFGGSLSVVEILTVLYFEVMNIDPKDPDKSNRDRLILSKGHAGPALYTTLASRGYFPLDDLKDLDQPLSKFPKHVDRLRLKGIDVSSGALGMGLSIAAGMAISIKVAKEDMGRVIGKGGRVANSIRVLLRVAAAREGKRASLDIVEP